MESSSAINNIMKRILKLLLTLSPFVIGVAYVSKELEVKQKKKFSLLRVLVILFVLGAGLLLSSIFYVQAHYDDTYIDSMDGCAVVFGAAVWKDDQPSHALNDRTQAAIELYKNGQVSCLVFSGGESTFGSHESTVMGQLAAAKNVPQQDMIFDYSGNNTLATIKNLDNTKRYVFVSNDFHMARIALIANKLGFENYGLHAAPYEYGRYDKNGKYFWREVGGTLILWFGL
jgi:vancomycin permeability regulator SanA